MNMTPLLPFLAVLVCALVVIIVFLKVKKDRITQRLQSELREQKSKHDKDNELLRKRLGSVESELESLAKYRGIADADAKAAEIVGAATTERTRLLTEAQSSATQLVAAAQAERDKIVGEAEAVRTEATQEAKTVRDKTRALLDEATLEAGTIVENANKRAAEIAGSAYEAMKNAALYEQTAKAMKNVIEGYGDQYLVPGRSLLDDLAEDFGHTEAGDQLRRARERARLMVRNGTAATCEYVEANRKETAINFVTDAFNGKVDSILSRVRHDNAGTLEQEIRDAFTLVNFNGKAFREARVTEEYCTARLEELRWAAVAQELKLQERDEQRRLREQMREEEKARREFERAIREAAKEEELLRKAMEKVQKEVDQANAEQRAKYEEQLRVLTEKLQAAEEKNQRALSMAQQTKRGHVYIISNTGAFGDDVYKIGLTRRLEPVDRIRELGDASVPFEFDIHAMIFCEDAPAVERDLHRKFALMQMNKVNFRKEFFRVSLKDLRAELETMGVKAHWTMTAEAREYRESQAIEKAIREDPKKLEAWLQRQLEWDPAENQLVEAA